jgi:hypothetical protein
MSNTYTSAKYIKGAISGLSTFLLEGTSSKGDFEVSIYYELDGRDLEGEILKGTPDMPSDGLGWEYEAATFCWETPAHKHAEGIYNTNYAK